MGHFDLPHAGNRRQIHVELPSDGGVAGAVEVNCAAKSSEKFQAQLDKKVQDRLCVGFPGAGTHKESVLVLPHLNYVHEGLQFGTPAR
eukprot:Skav216356  [mRNA]  locus=scaffold2385:255810:265391:+ [translate_table: standard]